MSTVVYKKNSYNSFNIIIKFIRILQTGQNLIISVLDNSLTLLCKSVEIAASTNTAVIAAVQYLGILLLLFLDTIPSDTDTAGTVEKGLVETRDKSIQK